MRRLALLLAWLLALPAAADDGLTALSDNFDDPTSLTNWQRVQQVEGWPNDQLARVDVNQSVTGCLTLIPHTSVWYQDFRGVLLFKPVRGDFVMTTFLRVTNRDGNGAPRSQFSLGGLLVRAPRGITPETWRPGGENYVFLSFGAANQPGQYQLETKTTVNSQSTVGINPTVGPDALLRIARVGEHLILLTRQPNTPWRVVIRFNRPDFPAELQAGVTAYTDWPTCEATGVRPHNTTVIQGGNPDVIALFDYVRYHRPTVPAALAGAALSDPAQVSDEQLLGFLARDPAP